MIKESQKAAFETAYDELLEGIVVALNKKSAFVVIGKRYPGSRNVVLEVNATKVWMSIDTVTSSFSHRWNGLLQVVIGERSGRLTKRWRTRKAGWPFEEMAQLLLDQVEHDRALEEKSKQQEAARKKVEKKSAPVKKLATSLGVDFYIREDGVCEMNIRTSIEEIHAMLVALEAHRAGPSISELMPVEEG